jgi:ATP-binding cassette subfamily F protein uup
MLAQRGADLMREQRKPEPPKVAKEAVPVSGVPEAAKRRMTFKDKHALETLPKTIAALQVEANALQQKLSDPQLYARDRATFEKASSELGALQQKLAAAEEQWLALEMLREELADDR